MSKFYSGTFSIVARCPTTGKLGVATSTANISVRDRVPHAKARIGAIATQGKTDPMLGIEGIKLLERGFSASHTLSLLLSKEREKEDRQLLVIDANNNKAAYTGLHLPRAKGHIIGENFIVGGNILRSDAVLIAMAEAFTKFLNLPLEHKLLISLDSGQRAGGDKRGILSAALLVVDIDESSLIDIYIDADSDPIGALKRILISPSMQ